MGKWHRQSSHWFRRCQRHWMPLLLGIIVTVVVFGLWHRLVVREQLHVQQLVQQEADAIQLQLNRELSSRILALERMASRWQASGGTPKALWEADAADYVQQFYGFQAIEWVDPSFHVRWVVPLKGNEVTQNLDLSRESRRRITLSIARDLPQTILTNTVTLAQGGKGFLAIVPIVTQDHTHVPAVDRFDGFIIGVFRFQALFDSALKPTPYYHVQIADRNEPIYEQNLNALRVEARYGQPQTALVQAYGVDWRLNVFPTVALIQQERSFLPMLVLGSGLSSAWALALVVYLGQKANSQARQTRSINQQLHDEIIRRQQVEANLRTSEERWQLALRGNNDGIWDWNVKTNEVFFSSRWKEMLGFEDPEIQDCWDEWRHRIHPDDVEETLQALLSHLTKKTPFYVSEYRLQCKDGSYKWMLDRGQALWDEAGNAVRMVGSHTDITQRRQAEESLRQSEEKFRTAIDFTFNWEYWQAPDGTFVYISPSCERITGYTPHEFIQDPTLLHTIIHPDDRLRLSHHLCQHETAIESIDYRIITQSGEVRWIAHICQPLFNKNGEFLGRRASNRDISERKRIEEERRQAELALYESESRFRVLVTYAPVGIFQTDAQGKCLYVNPRWSELTGLSFADAMDDGWTAALHPEDFEAIFTEWGQATEAGRPFALEYRFQHANGTVVWVSGQAIAVRDELETITHYFGTVTDITARKQAELALQKSEARFQAFMNHSPACAWITDINNTMLYVNETYLRVLLLPDEDVIGKCGTDFYPPELAQHYVVNNRRVAQTQQVLETIEVAPRRDGTIGHFLVYKFPIPDEAGQTLIGGVSIDITKQYQAEEALRQSEATKQAIIEAIPDLMLRMRSDGKYLDFISNTPFNTVDPVQVPPDATIYDILPTHLADLRMHHVEEALRSNSIQVYEQEIIVQGKLSYEEARVVPLFADEVLVMMRDITAQHIALQERNRVEEESQHQKEMLQAIIDHIPVMIALFDSQSRLKFINSQLERSLGWSLVDWQERDIFAECYPDAAYRQMVLEHMLAATCHWQDMTTLTATGQPLDTSWANVRLSNGDLVGIGQDISDRKHKEIALRQAVEAAEAANLAKSMFLANMSHELRTPLNVILGFAQVMAHDSSLTPRQQEDLQTIRRSGDHLLSLINDILDLSKIEAGHFSLDETGFDLISLLHNLRTMMSERARAKYLQVEFHIAADVPQFIVADEQKLRQVLLNLLSNAIKFTSQGQVQLAVSVVNCFLVGMENKSRTSRIPSRLTLQFQVTDTGVGIAPEEIDTIFDAFVQAEAGRKTIGGTGLGLTISQKLLELMGGKVAVTSTLGQGTQITCTLPVDVTSGVNIEPEQHERKVIGLMPGQPHRRILIVDDQLENRQLLVRLLTQLGLEVREAVNGYQAVEIWRDWQPDLTWMDIRMPDLDGYEATKQIRAIEQEPTSIIIALTAQASQSDRALALAAGCNDYISKPFREETLLLKMREYLGLEYLYAEFNPLKAVLSAPAPAELLASIDLAPLVLEHLALLPDTWLTQLEDAAMCGNDQAILDLADQLPLELAQLKNQCEVLAKEYQFEGILELIQTLVST